MCSEHVCYKTSLLYNPKVKQISMYPFNFYLVFKVSVVVILYKYKYRCKTVKIIQCKGLMLAIRFYQG